MRTQDLTVYEGRVKMNVDMRIMKRLQFRCSGCWLWVVSNAVVGRQGIEMNEKKEIGEKSNKNLKKPLSPSHFTLHAPLLT
jgi:hypothetical protein